jgi:16S rRNA (uracil1498-N3)-methyltransferase
MMSGGKNLARMYFSGELEPGRAYALAPSQAHHAARVLRLKAADAVTLFNGDGAEYPAVIERMTKGAVTVRVNGRVTADRESPLEVVLGQALSAGERMDYTVQKAVELGVAAIHPLEAGRSVVRLAAERAGRRVAHWQAVAIAACEQCGRNRVPPVAAIAPLERWLTQSAARSDGARRLLLTPRAEGRLTDLERPARSVLLLAGPEGGLTQEEESAARRSGFLPVSLGPRVLRTETAAVAALAAMQALWGDF